MEGYIKYYRQIIENEFYFSERFTKTQAWTDLLLLANYKPNSFFVRGNEVKLERGQLGYSIKSLAERWRWNERTVNKFLSALQKRGMIQHRKTQVTTVITITNYGLYQGDIAQNTEQTQNRIHLNKKVKKEKKVKNIYAIENLPINLNGECFIKTKFFFATRTLISELREKLGLDLSDESLREEFYGMEVWIESHKPKQNYKMFFVNWLKNAKTKKQGNSTAFKRTAKGEVTDQQLAEGLDKAFR